MAGVAPFLEVLPTRVRRGYLGGSHLERWTQVGEGRDGDRPEDWIASTTIAKNPGLPPHPKEGVTRVLTPGGRESDLKTEILRAPEYFVGEVHAQIRGAEIGFLAKLLDSSIRLHIQAHPTASFARTHLDSPYGKLEAYVILGAREGVQPYAFLGFQDAPTPSEWRRIITEQDRPAMLSRLNRMPLAAGEVWLVPGGVPHAIGEGVLMLEVMEPSDWVVRCEFEREGIVVPPAGRFMGRDLEFCLNVFDYRSESPADVRRRCRLEPRIVAQTQASIEEELVGPTHTDCFVVRRLKAFGPTVVPNPGRFRLMLVTAGRGTLQVAGTTRALAPASRFLFPAESDACELVPEPGSMIEAIFCLPGAASS